MTKNLIIAILFLTAAGEAVVLFEANRAKYWSEYYLYEEIYTAYYYSCNQNSPDKGFVGCAMDAEDYVRELKVSNNEH